MKKFTKVIMVIMIVALLLTTIIMPRTTKAADGDNEAIVTINFLDKDGSPLNFADYDKIGAYYLYDYSGYPAEGVNYTYTWSNGDTGSGTTDSDGLVNIAPSSTAPSNSVKINFGQLYLSGYDYGLFYYIEIDSSDYYRVCLNGETSEKKISNKLGDAASFTTTKPLVIDYYYGYDASKPAVINIDFRDTVSNEQLSNSDYEAMGKLKLSKVPGNDGSVANIPYSYEWSNGENGNGATDSSGYINIPSPQGENTSLKITINSLENRYYVEATGVDNNVFDGVNSSGVNREDGKDFLYKDTEFTISYLKHKYSKTATINFNFKHLDGTDWYLDEQFSMQSIFVTNGSGNPIKYDYKIDYGNGYIFEGKNGNLNSELNISSGERYIDCKKITLTLNMDTDIFVNTSVLSTYFGKLTINGNEVDNQGFMYVSSNTVKDGETLDLTFYHMDVGDATFGIYSYDGTLTDGNFEYHPYFDALPYHNADIKNSYYWTVEGDDTKHYYDRTDSNHNYSFRAHAPIGKAITLHNIPMQQSYGWHSADGSFPHNGNFLLAVSGPEYLPTITYNGEKITQELLNELGIYENVYIETRDENGERMEGVYPNYPGIASSGTGPRKGWDYKYYIVRKASTFMFHKDVNENDELAENGKTFHFRIKLTDKLTNKPLKGKVAYFVFDSLDDEFNADDVKYADIDSEGKIDVYLKAGQYVKLGRMIKDEDAFSYLTYNVSTGQNDVYVPELGTLPYEVKYEIEEVSDDYDSVLAVEGSNEGYGVNVNGLVTMEKNGCTVEELKEKLGGAEYKNTRKLGNLTVKKVVEGPNTDETFKFTVKITDSAKQFPEEYNYKKSDGTTGTIKFEKTGTTTIKDRDNAENEIECNIYTAEIELKNKEDLTIEGLPSGATYEVTEDEKTANKYKSTAIDATGTIKSNDSEEQSIAIFTNIYEEEKNIIERIISGEPKTGDIIVISFIVLAAGIIVLKKTSKVKSKNTHKAK